MKHFLKRLVMVIIGGLLIAAVLILIVELLGIGTPAAGGSGRPGNERGTPPPAGE